MSAGSAAVAELVHEVRGAAGSVRLALTTLLEAGDDPELRRELLESADGETRRLLRRLSLITPVVACLTANGRAESVQLRPALRSAATPARRAGAKVTMRVSGEPAVRARKLALEQGLVALVGAVAAGEWSSIKAHADDGAVVVVLRGASVDSRATRELSAAIAGAVGATAEVRATEIVLRFS